MSKKEDFCTFHFSSFHFPLWLASKILWLFCFVHGNRYQTIFSIRKLNFHSSKTSSRFSMTFFPCLFFFFSLFPFFSFFTPFIVSTFQPLIRTLEDGLFQKIRNRRVSKGSLHTMSPFSSSYFAFWQDNLFDEPGPLIATSFLAILLGAGLINFTSLFINIPHIHAIFF